MHRGKKNALAGVKSADVLAGLDYLSGNVAAQDVRQLYAGQPFANPYVEVIERASAHSDEHWIFARLRVGNIFVSQDFRPTEFVQANSFHIFIGSVKRLLAIRLGSSPNGTMATLFGPIALLGNASA